MGKNNHDEHSLGHSVPERVLYNVFAALMVLTVITVLAAQVDLGVLNIFVALIIASIKASLVALFFMHLKYEDGATWIYALIPLGLLALLLFGVFIDNPFRSPML